MLLEELTNREQEVFNAIVHSFIRSAEPVGSRYLAKYYDLRISAATIRNVMMDLEEKGLVSQPHTSAGRVPTDFGYRQYVNNNPEEIHLSDVEKSSIVKQLTQFSKDLDSIADQASRVLGDISNQLGFVLAPRFNQGKIQKIEFISLSDNKLLLVISVQSGLVKTILVEVENFVPRNLLEATNVLMNERLHNLSIAEFQTSIDERFRDVDVKFRTILNSVKSKTNQIFESRNDVYFAGAHNVINQPEFEKKERIGKILELLDRKDVLIRIVSEHQNDGVCIIIGDENKEELMKNCSLITTTYNVKDSTGTIGVVGPTRMQYPKIIALVQFIGDTLSYLTSK